jgi:hypothetical protein
MDDIDIHGYAGYRYIWSSIDIAPIESYPEMGLLLNYTPTKNWSIFLQFNANDDAIRKSFDQILVYGFLSYENSIYSIPYKIRIGKLRHEFGLHNADIINPSTRPGVIAPQSLYWNSLAATLVSGYGIHLDIYYKFFKLGYTISESTVIDPEKESIVWSGHKFLGIKPFFGSHQILNLSYDNPDWDIKSNMGYTKILFNKKLDSVELITFGIEYDNPDFNATGEIMIVKAPNNDWDEIKKILLGYSLRVGYYITPDIEINMALNVYEKNKYSDLGPNYVPDASKWEDFSIGISKQFQNIEFKLDVHKAYGGRVLDPSVWQNKKIDSWWYLGTSIVYHF